MQSPSLALFAMTLEKQSWSWRILRLTCFRCFFSKKRSYFPLCAKFFFLPLISPFFLYKGSNNKRDFNLGSGNFLSRKGIQKEIARLVVPLSSVYSLCENYNSRTWVHKSSLNKTTSIMFSLREKGFIFKGEEEF